MKRLIFSLIILITLVLVFFLLNRDALVDAVSDEEVINKVSMAKDGEQEVIHNERYATDECDTYKSDLSTPELENLENRRWSNTHIKHIDGEVYRIRYFFDDGPNGEYKKTILYKEDQTEFPHIVKVYRGFESEALKEYFEQGEVIWQEQAYEATLNGKTVYWRKINNEFVDLNIDEGLSCL